MEVSLTTILAQVINFGILFFLFRKFLTKPMVTAIEERRSLIKKIEGADKAYDQKMQEAEENSKLTINEWLKKKDKIIVEAWILGNKRKDEIIADAKVKAGDIVEEANKKIKHLETELKSNFANGVKRTSFSVIKKLFDKDKSFQSEYLDEIVDEIVQK